eukprot:11711231-Ditylum_brightwellii.AAC.1
MQWCFRNMHDHWELNLRRLYQKSQRVGRWYLKVGPKDAHGENTLQYRAAEIGTNLGVDIILKRSLKGHLKVAGEVI